MVRSPPIQHLSSTSAALHPAAIQPDPRRCRAQVGGLSLSEMNALELEFLFALDFDLFIRPKDIAHAIRDLLETSGPAAAGWPALADEDLQIAYPVRCEPPARCMPAAASRRRTRIWRARPAAPADSAPAVCRLARGGARGVHERTPARGAA